MLIQFGLSTYVKILMNLKINILQRHNYDYSRKYEFIYNTIIISKINNPA